MWQKESSARLLCSIETCKRSACGQGRFSEGQHSMVFSAPFTQVRQHEESAALAFIVIMRTMLICVVGLIAQNDVAVSYMTKRSAEQVRQHDW